MHTTGILLLGIVLFLLDVHWSRKNVKRGH
jgi:hypothetical protein